MSLIDRLLQQEVVSQVWQQLTGMLSSESRVRQLFSLKPIDLYHTTTQFEADGAVIDVEIESFLENILKKRIKRANDFISMGKMALEDNRAYNFHVLVTAKTDYLNAAKYLNHHFSGKDYYFGDNQYYLHIDHISMREERGRIIGEADVRGYARKGWLTKRSKGTLIMYGKPTYLHDELLLVMNDFNYSLHHTDLITRLLSRWWHEDIRKLLHGALQYHLEEDMFNGKVMAQEEINQRQKQSGFRVNGILTALDLQRIYFDQNGLQAVMMAKGKLELRR
jgi:hypothetical protein